MSDYASVPTLKSASDWPTWHLALRYAAEQQGVWKYLQPGDARAALPTEPKAPELSEDVIDSEDASVLDLETKRYNLRMAQYEVARRKYEKVQGDLKAIQMVVLRTVSNDIIMYLGAHSNLPAMSDALRKELRVVDGRLCLENEVKWISLMGQDLKRSNFEEWLKQVKQTHLLLKDQDSAIIQGLLPYRNTLDSILPLGLSAWALFERDVDEATNVGSAEGLRPFHSFIDSLGRVATKKLGTHATGRVGSISYKSAGGNQHTANQHKERRPDRNGQKQKTSAERCPCGGLHSWQRCRLVKAFVCPDKYPHIEVYPRTGARLGKWLKGVWPSERSGEDLQRAERRGSQRRGGTLSHDGDETHGGATGHTPHPWSSCWSSQSRRPAQKQCHIRWRCRCQHL